MDSRAAALVGQFISLLLTCKKSKNLVFSRQAHAQISYHGLEAHASLGNYLVPIYVECGSMLDATYVFERMSNRNEFSWTSLIQGHVEHGELEHAIVLFHAMQKESIQPSNYTYVAVVKACASLRLMDTGLNVHSKVVKEGLDEDPFVGNSLLDMYARCECLAEAQIVFDLLPTRIIVSWNSLITGFVEHGSGEVALGFLEQMQTASILPNTITLTCSLKACSILKDIKKGQELHCEIVNCEFDDDLSVWTALVATYAKCGFFKEARWVIGQLPMPNNVPWNALMSGYVENGCGEEALECLEQMQAQNISPNSVSYVCTLQGCIIVEELEKGQEIHAAVVKVGLDTTPSVCNSLISMYTKGGAIVEAQEVLDKLPMRSIVSWTAILAGYADLGLLEEALKCLDQMCLEGFPPDASTYACCLKVCNIDAITMGQKIHDLIVKKGYEGNLVVANMLMDMYIKNRAYVDAEDVFYCLPSPNLVSWNTLIAGYAEHGLGTESLDFFHGMESEGMSPDATTFISTLKACGCAGVPDMGLQVHGEAIKKGLEWAGVLGNSIVDMYVKFGMLGEAQFIFNQLPVRTLVSWNSIITGFCDVGNVEQVLKHVERMHGEGFPSDVTTFVCNLKACSSSEFSNTGQKQYAEVVLQGFESHPFVGSALVDMYVNCGMLLEARHVLDGLPVRNVVVWTAMISGYVEHRLSEEALECLERMCFDQVLPNHITYTCGLKACGSISALLQGQELHKRMINEGFIGLRKNSYGKGIIDHTPADTCEVVRREDTELLLSNALMDMYCKCGSMDDAHKLYDQLLATDLTTCNVLLMGYVRQGNSHQVFTLVDKMRGVIPNELTFLSLLSVCSHEGLVSVGQKCFEVMQQECSVCPNLEHYNCMVDLFSRSGQLQAAKSVLENMPLEPDLVTWSTLLGASKNWGDVELGRQSFKWVARLDEGNAAAFIILSNMYKEADIWEDAKYTEAIVQVANS